MSISTAECFILRLRSLEMVANSSSSHNLNPILEGTSTKGVLFCVQRRKVVVDVFFERCQMLNHDRDHFISAVSTHCGKDIKLTQFCSVFLNNNFLFGGNQLICRSYNIFVSTLHTTVHNIKLTKYFR